MKEWKQPNVHTMDIEDTANGGNPSQDFDQQWFDEKGALHVNFTPSGNQETDGDEENKGS